MTMSGNLPGQGEISALRILAVGIIRSRSPTCKARAAEVKNLFNEVGHVKAVGLSWKFEVVVGPVGVSDD